MQRALEGCRGEDWFTTFMGLRHISIFHKPPKPNMTSTLQCALGRELLLRLLLRRACKRVLPSWRCQSGGKSWDLTCASYANFRLLRKRPLQTVQCTYRQVCKGNRASASFAGVFGCNSGASSAGWQLVVCKWHRIPCVGTKKLHLP